MYLQKLKVVDPFSNLVGYWLDTVGRQRGACLASQVGIQGMYESQGMMRRCTISCVQTKRPRENRCAQGVGENTLFQRALAKGKKISLYKERFKIQEEAESCVVDHKT